MKILSNLILLITIIYSMLFIMAVDSLYDAGYFWIAILICAGLISLCYKLRKYLG